MEDKFYNDEFEQFLRQQANNHRMYPTDGVWQGIYKKLHGDKKWPALTIVAITFLTAVIAISVYFSPKPSIFDLDPTKTTAAIEPNKEQNAFNRPLKSSVSDNENENEARDYVSQQNPPEPFETVATTTPGPTHLSEIEPENTTTQQGRSGTTSATAVAQKTGSFVSPAIDGRASQNENKGGQKLFADQPTELSPAGLNASSGVIEGDATSASGEQTTTPSVSNPPSKIEKDRDDKNMADEFLKQHKDDIALYTTTRKVSQKKKFSYNIYIAPSVSYRRLKEEDKLNRESENTNGPVALNYVTDVNKVVRHKPGTGLEAGVAFKYHLTNTLGIKAGLQFNVRQYNIQAYRSSGELATIELLGRNNGVDSINTFAVYRNNNGFGTTELINRHYQLSIPIGLEWEVVGNKKVKFNIAANIQPTYTFNRNSYLLTTDYKNYAANQAMLRHWNINSNIEAFMSVKLGEYRWQLGPQLRYQHLPTFITEYPIREHLMDYGFKIGVSKFIK